jgi:GTP-binding protein
MELGSPPGHPKRTVRQPQGRHQTIYELPTRALLGLRNILMTNTKGTVIMNSLVIGYQPLGAPLQQLRNGVLIAFETGTTTPYSLETPKPAAPSLSARPKSLRRPDHRP